MVEQSGNTCDLDVYRWTHWLHYEHDDEVIIR